MENENGTLKLDYIYMCLEYSSKSLWNLKTDKNVAINCPSDILTYLFGIKFYGAETRKYKIEKSIIIWSLTFVHTLFMYLKIFRMKWVYLILKGSFSENPVPSCPSLKGLLSIWAWQTSVFMFVKSSNASKKP